MRPEKLWQNQPSELPPMSLQEIQRRSLELHARTRKKLLATQAVPILTGLLYAFAIIAFPAHGAVLHPPFALALAWSIAGQYFLTRGMWSPRLPGDAGPSPGLEFCREEIRRQRDLLRRSLWWSFGPALMSIATLIFALAMAATRERGLFPNGVPFLVLVFAWLVSYFAIRLREQQALQRELDELQMP